MATVTLKIGQEQAEHDLPNAKLTKIVDRFVRRRIRILSMGSPTINYGTMTDQEKMDFTLTQVLDFLSGEAREEQRHIRHLEYEATLQTELEELDHGRITASGDRPVGDKFDRVEKA